MLKKGSLLHVGCYTSPLPFWATSCEETRLDIDPECNPDIVASMLNMGQIGEYDYVFSCHCLEHVFPHEARVALGEMRRVLVDGGTVIVIVPDIEGVSPNKDTLYESPGGPVCGLDVLYGKASLVEINPLMGHKNGFTLDILMAEFKSVGLKRITGTSLSCNSIMVTGEK